MCITVHYVKTLYRYLMVYCTFNASEYTNGDIWHLMCHPSLLRFRKVRLDLSLQCGRQLKLWLYLNNSGLSKHEESL